MAASPEFPQIDLMAGRMHAAAAAPHLSPRILMFDSGLGGLTVHAEVARARPDADILYVADDAGFPYGGWEEGALTERVVRLFSQLLAAWPADCVVIACNTASTLVLPALRARFGIPFVGTVPAIKPAAERSVSGLISVLATPGTVKRDYTQSLIRQYAEGCEVTLVGSTRLAAFAEAEMRGEPVEDDLIAEEIAPCFIERAAGEGRMRATDVVTLSCTHYPLLLPRLRALAPWPVVWLDPAPAVARRVTALIGGLQADAPHGSGYALFTAGPAPAALEAALRERGLTPFAA